MNMSAKMNLGPAENIIDGRHVRRVVLSGKDGSVIRPDAEGILFVELADMILETSRDIPPIPGERIAMVTVITAGNNLGNRQVSLVRLPFIHQRLTREDVGFLAFAGL